MSRGLTKDPTLKFSIQENLKRVNEQIHTHTRTRESNKQANR